MNAILAIGIKLYLDTCIKTEGNSPDSNQTGTCASGKLVSVKYF